MEMSKLFSKEIRSELLCDLSRQQRVYSTLSTKTVCNQNEKPIFGRPGFDVERMVEVQIQMFLNFEIKCSKTEDVCSLPCSKLQCVSPG